MVGALLGQAGQASAEEVPVTSTEDVTPPRVSGMTISPLSVDVRDGSTQGFTATLAATDDLSGLASASAVYRIPSGNRTISFPFGDYNRTAGNANNGTYTVRADVTPLAANGSYQLESLQVRDVVGNFRTYRAADNVAPASLTVLSTADAVPPVVTAVSVAPNPLDVSTGIKAAQVEARVTDDLSGVSYVWGTFTSPSRRQAAGFTAAPVAGATGVARGMTTVARYSEPGEWALSQLCAVDKAGNQACFNTATTPSVGQAFPLALGVISNPADNARPAATAYRLSPGTIDVTDGDRTVQTAFDVADELSGVQYAYVTFASPRTVGASPEVMRRYGFAYAPSIYSYTWNGDGTYTVGEDDTKRLRAGTLTASTVFPRYDRSGDWKVEQVCVIDNVNWQTCYSAGTTPSLTTLGPSGLTVNWNRAPSVTVTGVTQTSYPAGSEPTPGCRVSDLEDGLVTVDPVVTGPDAAGLVTVTCSYTDTGGITASASKTYLVIRPQNTAPVVAVTGVSATAYEFGAVPAAGCSVTDAEDADESATPVLSDVTGPLAAYGLGSVTVTCTYTDAGGLSDTDSVTYTIVDTTPASLQTPASVTAWATSPAGAAVAYTVSASDAADPDPAIDCQPPSGSVFPIGTTTVTCTVTDVAGNTATGSFPVTVVPSCTASGLRPPINADGSSVFKLGATVPLKVALSDCYGTAPEQVDLRVTLTRIDTSPEGTVNEVVSSGSANDGTLMRHDAGGAQHIYNLSTKRSQFCSTATSAYCTDGSLTAGTYRVVITAPELATPVTATFGIRG